MADEEREDTYDPSTVEVNRARQQGDGLGFRDLQRQRDPSDLAGAGGGHVDVEADQAGPPGEPDEASDEREGDAVSTDWPGA